MHLADNNALNSSDKFAKVRPLFKAINEQGILSYQTTQHVSNDKSIVPHLVKYGAKQ